MINCKSINLEKIINLLAIFCLGLVLAACQATSKQPAKNPVPTSGSEVITTGKDGWTTINSPDGGFAVKMPAKPEESSQEVTTQAGAINAKLYTASANDTTYLVAYSDYPQGTLKRTRPDQLLTSARDAAVAKINGTIYDAMDLSFSGFPGIEIKAVSKDGNTYLRSRFYLVSNRLYQVFALSPKANANSPDIDKFFSSFALTNF